MRLLSVLAFACGALSLATGSVEPRAEQPAVKDTVQHGVENAALAAPEIAKPGQEEASSDLAKRVIGGAGLTGIPFPVVGNPVPMVVLGVTVTFVMGSRWVREGSRNVVKYFVKSVGIGNGSGKRIYVQAVASGTRFLARSISATSRIYDDPPEGATTFDLYVDGLQDEL
ncbi:hypothetical protein E4U21_005637 [Claviceps maximensis]|nr:hypothetical protein E4U21_005637 [Claviceps maximensis]